MKKIIIITIAVLSLCFYGCVFVNLDMGGVRPEGEQEEHIIKVREFNSIRINGYCNVVYYSAPSDSITFKVHPNLLEYYKIDIVNKELVIYTTGRIRYGSKNAATLIVSAPELKSVVISGFEGGHGGIGSFTTMDDILTDSFSILVRGAGGGKINLDVNNLKADLAGAGKLDLTGRAYAANINLSGAGELNAFSLQTRDSTVNFSGTGTMKINCTENLNINASGVGTIEYIGSPILNSNTSGIVNVRKVN